MADRNMTKAERRAARAAGGGQKQKKRADAGEGEGGKRKKAARKGAPADGGAGAPPADASFEERLDWRLTRLEEAVAAQSKVSEELLNRMNAVLSDAASDAGSEKS